MRELPEMLQEFACICQSHPEYRVSQLCSAYFKQLSEDDLRTADRYYYWFVMAGDAVRSESPFVEGGYFYGK